MLPPVGPDNLDGTPDNERSIVLGEAVRRDYRE